ncbi:MAG: dihydropteroate synthase [Mariprofundus sp.]|nr:dihydropteroate synthase [Mariprofundus sp.]
MASRWHRSPDADVTMMGVLNCTPDSFSDGTQYLDSTAALRHGLAMQQAGASIIDVGGESTRPGATPVAEQHELERVIPVVKALSQAGCIVSLDTMKAEVISQGIAAGASMINDVSALCFDPDSLSIVAGAQVELCLMHMQGAPDTMQANPHYHNVIDEVCSFFQQRLDICMQAGIPEASIILDPGIGFGKRLQDNLTLIRNIDQFKQRFGMPILLGVSRKSFLGLLTAAPVEDRELETAVAGAMATAYGVDILRVHDVTMQKRATTVASAINNAKALTTTPQR